ncbi:hypothetical protein V8D89_004937 [Ganoderma adspersum]
MDPSDAAAELSAEYYSLFLSNYCSIASSVVLIYEYFLTIDEEVKYFWKRKFTGASAVFFLNRYIPLTSNLLAFTGFAPMSNKTCTKLARFAFGYGLLQYIFWAAFSGSRAFALTNRNWIISLLVCGLSLVPVVANLINIHYDITGEIVPLTGCDTEDLTPLDVNKRCA